MADFDLTQTDAQVQSILNDGQNMQGAGAQTTLTTESVLLKDVNGNYHKILKSSFTEAIRDTLAGLLVNNDKGTTINQIAAIANGDFGSITPANLASVLDVFVAGSKWISNLNDTTLAPGIYNINSNTKGHPSSGICITKIEIWGGEQTFIRQTVSRANGELWLRSYDPNASAWQQWERIDNFGANTPADLASLLGVGTLYNINNVGTVGFRKICHIPANGKTNACFILGVAKAQYKNKDNNYSQLVTVVSDPAQQSTLLPLFVEGVNVGETKFYYKQTTDGTDVFVDVSAYSDAIWLRIINNNGIDFSNCFAGTTETTLTTTRC